MHIVIVLIAHAQFHPSNDLETVYEARLACLATLTALPGTRTEDDVPPADMVRLKSRQHPDRPN